MTNQEFQDYKKNADYYALHSPNFYDLIDIPYIYSKLTNQNAFNKIASMLRCKDHEHI